MPRIARIGAVTAFLVIALGGGAPRALANVVINEFMADNASTLTNQSGQTCDWIELYNASSNAVNLANWSLTDDAGEPRKWVFPAGIVLAPFDYLLIMADGKTQNWINGDLHANFRLSSDGEYLGLIRPDGFTVVSAYAPTYPAQGADVSFGFRPEVDHSDMVVVGQPYRYGAPAAELGLAWTTTNFNDAAWSTGVGPLGYETRPGGYAEVIQTPIASSQRGVYVRHTFAVNGADRFDTLALRVKFDDGIAAYLNGVKVTGANVPTTPAWNSYALADRSNSDALHNDDFDLSPSLPLLQDGTNVLALHVMNITSAPLNSDLLLAATLDAESFTPSVGSEWRYFHGPTPGQRNVIGEADLARDVLFDHPRGYYDGPILLKLSTDLAGFDIRFTLDGSSPDSAPALTYTNRIALSRTTVVRAQATKAGFEPSRVTTATFLFTNDVIRQAAMKADVLADPIAGPQVAPGLLALPTLSIATADSNLFSSATGIYLNYEQRGEAWERPVSVEWIVTDGGPEFQINCGMRIYGDYGRRSAQKSFRLLFKGKYGASKLEFPLFDDPTAVSAFDTLILRGGYNDKFHANGLVDPFVRGCQLVMNGVASHSSYVHLFLNGVYWGIYNPSERPDPAFASSYYGGEKELWDGNNAGYPTGESLFDTYYAMNSAASTVSDNVNFQRLRGCNPDGTRNTNYVVHLDVENQIDYMLAHIWAGTSDWPHKNYYADGARVDSTGWKYFVWDSEYSLRSLTSDVSGTAGPANIHGRLRQSPEYRLMFADHVRRHLFEGGALSPAACQARYGALVARVELAIPVNAARWSNASAPAAWRSAQDAMLQTYFPQRTAVVLDQLRRTGLYPVVEAPEFGQRGGSFSNSFVLTMQASHPVYYTLDGRDPRVVGSGAIIGSLYTGPVPLVSSVFVKARCRTAQGEWSALTEAVFTSDSVFPLRISEIMADPRSVPANSPYAASDYEYVEVYNSGTRTMNLALAAFTEGIDFTFPSLLLNAGGYAVVVRNAAAFVERYGPSGILVAGEFAGQLDSNGEQVVLRGSAHGPVLANVTYGSGRHWPLAAQGAGHSLVPLILDGQVGGALDYAGNWRASAYHDGSPGRADPPPVRDLVINEILAHTDYTNAALPEYDSNDWAELFNVGQADVVLTNWYLSDDLDALTKWPIPATAVVTGGGWIVFDEVTGFHSPITNGFGLNKGGERMVLSHLPGAPFNRVADVVQFKGQESHASLGRYPDGVHAWYALEPTSNRANALPAERVVLSEIMYHPAPTAAHPEDNTHDEYIELHNPTASAVALENEVGGWRLDGGVTYQFSTGTVIPADGYLIVVPFDPSDGVELEAFLAAHGVPQAGQLVRGPYAGQLSNAGERLALERPQAPDVPEDPVSWVVVDELVYADGAPWPGTVDGSGLPLQRITSGLAGTLPDNWSGTFAASPGLPQAKVGIAQPQPGAAIFAPCTLPIQITVDAKQVIGSVQNVRLVVDGQAGGQVAGPPYEGQLVIGTNAGVLSVHAELVDGAGTNWSAVTELGVHTLDNAAGVERLTDVSARLQAQLRGPGSVNLTFFWGAQDSGTNAAGWDRSGSIGTVGEGLYVADVAGLEPAQPYVYRCRARAERLEGWTEAKAFSTWAVTNWPHRLRIDFSGYDRGEALTNFAALVLLSTNIPGFSYAGFTTPDGSDLRFTSGANGASLPYEIEAWNTGDVSTVWVRVPRLAGAQEFIFAYWGWATANEAPTYTRNGDTWEAPYRGVWHTQDAFTDSSAGQLLVDLVGTTATTGIVCNARQFDGSAAFVDLHTANSWYAQNLEGLTFSAWVRPTSTGAMGLFGADDTSTDKARLLLRSSLGKWTYGVKANEVRPFTVLPGVWQLVALVLRNGEAWAYMNDRPGQLIGTYTNFTPLFDPWLGAVNGASSYFSGAMDEVRLAGAARSGAWIWAHYCNVASNAWFQSYTVGAADPFDADGDGVPDTWEQRHFGSAYDPEVDGLRDDDGDGLRNADEYVTGTDPTNETSSFAVAVSATGVVGLVEFDTVVPDALEYPNLTRWYSLECSPQLGAPWTGVEGYTNLPATGARVSAPATPTNAPFYRGRVWLQAE